MAKGGTIMPAYRDPDTQGKWYCQFYYTDWTGQRKKKKKRGFAFKRDALDWEADFLKRQQADLSMTVPTFVDLYLEDMAHRLRASTLAQKRFVFDLKIKPYFANRPLSAVTPADVRQ